MTHNFLFPLANFFVSDFILEPIFFNKLIEGIFVIYNLDLKTAARTNRYSLLTILSWLSHSKQRLDTDLKFVSAWTRVLQHQITIIIFNLIIFHIIYLNFVINVIDINGGLFDLGSVIELLTNLCHSFKFILIDYWF